jgi:HlyD family secretion protein
MHNQHAKQVASRISLFLLVLLLAPVPLGANDPKPPRVVLEIKGYLVPASQVTVGPKVRGQVVELMFEEGQQVKAGEVLARLDAEEYHGAFRLATAKLSVAEAEWVKAKEGVDKAGIAIARAKLDVAAAEVRIAQHRLDGTTIRAPIAGTVLVKRAELGTMMDPKANQVSSILCEMADLRTIEVELWIPERDVPKVAKGHSCVIRLESIPNTTYRGHISRVLPVADRAKGALGIRVRVEVPAGEMRLRPELSAIVQILAK